MILGLFWSLAIVTIWLPLPAVVYGLFISISFGTLAVVPFQISGGITILPTTILSSIVIVRMVLRSDAVTTVDAVLNPRRLGLLAAFLIYALVLTVIAPRIFAGAPTMGLNTSQLTLLAPSSGNITQGLYLTNSCLMTLAMFLFLFQKDGRQAFRKGLIIGGMAVVVSGVADMATYGTAVLDPLRTAGYALLTNADMAGTRRVVGLHAEASAFGYVALSLGSMITLMHPAETLGRGWRWLGAPVGWSCLLMAALSTSSGALVGLIVLLVVMVFDTIIRLFRGQAGAEAARLRHSLGALTILVIAAGLVVTLLPSVGAQLSEVFDAAIVRKTSTTSFEERLYWNTVSLDGLKATGGFGLGVGSTRASSWFVALASGTGVIGTVLLAAFLLNALLRPVGPVDSADRLLLDGAKRTLLVSMLPFAGTTTSVDFGVLIAIVFAVMIAIPAAFAQTRGVIPATSPLSRRRGRPVAPAHRPARR